MYAMYIIQPNSLFSYGTSYSVYYPILYVRIFCYDSGHAVESLLGMLLWVTSAEPEYNNEQ